MAEREELRSRVVIEGAQEAERAYARIAAAVKNYADAQARAAAPGAGAGLLAGRVVPAEAALAATQGRAAMEVRRVAAREAKEAAASQGQLVEKYRQEAAAINFAAKASKDMAAVQGKAADAAKKAAADTDRLTDAQKRGAQQASVFGKAMGVAASLGVTYGAWRLVQAGVGQAVEVERYTKSFVSLTGSAAAARQRVEELFRFRETAPFETDDILQAARNLMQVDKYSVQTMRDMGNLGAVSGQTIEAISKAYQKLFASTRPGMGLMQLMRVVPGLRKELGARIPELRKGAEGIEVAKVTDLMAAAGGAERLRSVLHDIIQLKFGDAMAQQFDTLGGSWVSVQHAWGDVQRHVFETLKPEMVAGSKATAFLLRELDKAPSSFKGLVGAALLLTPALGGVATAMQIKASFALASGAADLKAAADAGVLTDANLALAASERAVAGAAAGAGAGVGAAGAGAAGAGAAGAGGFLRGPWVRGLAQAGAAVMVGMQARGIAVKHAAGPKASALERQVTERMFGPLPKTAAEAAKGRPTAAEEPEAEEKAAADSRAYQLSAIALSQQDAEARRHLVELRVEDVSKMRDQAAEQGNLNAYAAQYTEALKQDNALADRQGYLLGRVAANTAFAAENAEAYARSLPAGTEREQAGLAAQEARTRANAAANAVVVFRADEQRRRAAAQRDDAKRQEDAQRAGLDRAYQRAETLYNWAKADEESARRRGASESAIAVLEQSRVAAWNRMAEAAGRVFDATDKQLPGSAELLRMDLARGKAADDLAAADARSAKTRDDIAKSEARWFASRGPAGQAPAMQVRSAATDYLERTGQITPAEAASRRAQDTERVMARDVQRVKDIQAALRTETRPEVREQLLHALVSPMQELATLAEPKAAAKKAGEEWGKSIGEGMMGQVRRLDFGRIAGDLERRVTNLPGGEAFLPGEGALARMAGRQGGRMIINAQIIVRDSAEAAAFIRRTLDERADQWRFESYL
jgi:hypothetical protein